MRAVRFTPIFLIVAVVLSGCGWTRPAEEKVAALQGKKMTVYHSPTCRCCKEYVEYMRSKGVDVKSVERRGRALNSIKRRHGLSRDSTSCHTGIIDDYVVEGHVPAQTVAKLLEEKPGDLQGITIPGMPQHAPGMGGPIGEELVISSFDERGRITGTFETVRY